MMKLDLREGLPPRPYGPQMGDWVWDEERSPRLPVIALLSCPRCRRLQYFHFHVPVGDWKITGVPGGLCGNCGGKP